MTDGRQQADAQYMVVRSDSDGQLERFEAVHPPPNHRHQQPQYSQPQKQASLHNAQHPGRAPHDYHPSDAPLNGEIHYSSTPQQQPVPSAHIVQAGCRSRANSRSSHGHSRPPSRRSHSRNPSIPHQRTRTNTAASSEGSVSSESEFITYSRDGEDRKSVV